MDYLCQLWDFGDAGSSDVASLGFRRSVCVDFGVSATYLWLQRFGMLELLGCSAYGLRGCSALVMPGFCRHFGDDLAGISVVFLCWLGRLNGVIHSDLHYNQQ